MALAARLERSTNMEVRGVIRFVHSRQDRLECAGRQTLWYGERDEEGKSDANDAKVAELIWLMTHEREDQ
jgi:hypothetical protein